MAHIPISDISRIWVVVEFGQGRGLPGGGLIWPDLMLLVMPSTCAPANHGHEFDHPFPCWFRARMTCGHWICILTGLACQVPGACPRASPN